MEELRGLALSADKGKILKEGINTVIVGKPNAGKSSLLNILVGEDRAIVTDIAGTTRDILEESVRIHGIGLNIIDTAGIRFTQDVVEKIGVEKAKKYANEADLILYVTDSSVPLDKSDEEIMDLIQDKKCIILLNKSDLETVVTEDLLRQRFKKDCLILKTSIKDQTGLDQFEQILKDMFFDGQIRTNDEVYITNMRHKEAILNDLKASEENEAVLGQNISDYQKQLEVLRTEESEKMGLVSEWDVSYEKMIQKQEFEQTNLERIEGELNRSKEELTEVQTNLESCLSDIDVRTKNIEEIEKTISTSYHTQSDAEISLKEKQKKKEEMTQKQKNFFQAREEISEKKNALDKEVYRLNAQKEKLEESIETQINYMWTEYEITLNNAVSLRNENMNHIPEMKRQIAEIKEEIRKLGDVNVNAIEDYKALMERYTFMKNQHDDLMEAEKTLEGIIEELDTAMRRQFAEKFEEIKREFDKVFKELFGGGKGTLELIEDEDILEAGIRIIAQPPGKKLQNMMQLSGGEKSFTAIALLFAIQNLKPSPFCLLDEIEAALDEENVGRFARYLNKLTKSTQFIVITHRRGTMEQADRLYGITMQEKGISTLVSVNLVDSEVDQWSQEDDKK